MIFLIKDSQSVAGTGVTDLEGEFILLTAPDVQARVVAPKFPEPLGADSKQASSHHRTPDTHTHTHTHCHQGLTSSMAWRPRASERCNQASKILIMPPLVELCLCLADSSCFNALLHWKVICVHVP